jgi:hypothetical protein
MNFLNILQLLQVILAIYVLMLVFKKGALNPQFHVALVCLVVSILAIPPFGRNFINGATMESKEGYSKEEHHKDHHARKEEHHKDHHARKEEHHKDHHARNEEHHKDHHARNEEHHEERIIRRETGHDHHHHGRRGHHHHDKRRHEEHDKTSKDHIQPIFPTPTHKHNPSPYTPTHPATKSTVQPATGSATKSATKSTVQPAANVVKSLSPPESIQMWMNNSVVYIIGKGRPGATLELSISKSPFTNILPSDITVNNSGEIEYSINGNGNNAENTLFNNIVTELNETTVYFRLSYKGQTSPIISWNDYNFGYCYSNNPQQNTAKNISSFQNTLKDANDYCVNTLGWPSTNNGLPTSWP